MKRFEIPEIRDDMQYVTLRYYNNPEKPEVFREHEFYLNNTFEKSLFQLCHASQTLYDRACEFGKKNTFTPDRYNEGFSNAELKKINSQSTEDAVNKVVFSIAVTLQKVSTEIIDATREDDVKILGLLSKIIYSLNKLFSLENTLKILDKNNLAPANLTKNNIDMARHLRDSISEISSTITNILAYVTDESFLKEQGLPVRTAIKAAAGIINKIHTFTHLAYTNFDQAIKEYEKKHPLITDVIPATVSPKQVVTSTATTETVLTQPVAATPVVTEIPLPEKHTTIKKRIALLKNQIKNDSEDLKNRQLTNENFSPLSQQLQQTLNTESKENANILMDILDKVKPYTALKITCNQIKLEYDNEKQKLFKDKKQITAIYNNLWSALVNHVNGTIKENNKQIPVIKERLLNKQNELTTLNKELLLVEKQMQETTESKPEPAAHILTKAFWLNLWNKFIGLFTRSSTAKQATENLKKSPSDASKEPAVEEASDLDAPSFKSTAFSSPVPKRARSVTSTAIKAEEEVLEPDTKVSKNK